MASRNFASLSGLTRSETTSTNIETPLKSERRYAGGVGELPQVVEGLLRERQPLLQVVALGSGLKLARVEDFVKALGEGYGLDLVDELLHPPREAVRVTESSDM